MKIVLNYISALIFSAIGFFGFIYLHSMIDSLGFEIAWGGEKSQIFWGIFLGLPLGSICGFIVVDKLYYNIESWNILGIMTAFMIFIMCNIVGLYILDKAGGELLLIMPFFIIFICTCVYNFW